MKPVEQWNRVPREIVLSVPLEVSIPGCTKPWNNTIGSLSWSSSKQEVGQEIS